MKDLPDPPSPRSQRSPRNRPQTEEKLRRAVEELLVEGGFAALTPSAVGRRAGVDKMLIYRYFGDLPGLVRSIANAPDFFPSFEDWCGPDPKALMALPPSERAATMLQRYAQVLIAKPVVLELMVWELVERNELTAIMEEAREQLGLRLMAEMFPDAADPARLQAVAVIVTAGLSYLALRRRKIRWFGGIDLKSDEGWRQIADAAAALAAQSMA